MLASSLRPFMRCPQDDQRMVKPDTRPPVSSDV